MSDISMAILKWIIPNYNSEEDIKTSQTFIVAKNQNITGRLISELWSARNDRRSYESHLLFYLRLDQFSMTKYKTFKLNVEYSILNALNQKELTQSITLSEINFCEDYYLGIIKVSNHLIKYLVDGNLVLLFEIEEYFDVENLQLLEEKETFLTDQRLSDVTLKVGEKIIYAVKGILASKSPFFNAMFSTDMKESVSGKVEIVDIDYEVFIEILRFMYTGEVQNLDSLGLNILKAAHFYQMSDLLNICERSLIKNIEFENAVEILKVADDCDIRSLKYNCLLFMKHNPECCKKSHLSENVRDRPDLLLEIIESISFLK